MTPEQEVVADALAAIDAVARSARDALPILGSMPTSNAEFDALSPIQRIAATALLKQFEQIEGLLTGLFRGILRILGVRLKGLYALDIANRMVELGILDDPHRWVAIVKLRNELVHEYPLGAADRYDRFVAAHAAFPALFDAAERARRVVVERCMLDPTE